jgi:hypothetical protein
VYYSCRHGKRKRRLVCVILNSVYQMLVFMTIRCRSRAEEETGGELEETGGRGGT